MNFDLIAQYLAIGGICAATGFAGGILVAIFERSAIAKLIQDTLKDDTQAWDFVRMAGAVGIATYLGGWDVAIFHDPMVMVTHATDFGLGMVATLGAYAGGVVGHSYAKK